MNTTTILDEYKNYLSEFLTKKAKEAIVNVFEQGNMKLIIHSKMEDNDGTSQARIVHQNLYLGQGLVLEDSINCT